MLSSDLVIIQNDKAVTTSIIIADIFQKAHNKVLRDIRELKCSSEFKKNNFFESSYKNLQNRTMPMYIITVSGFFMLVTGYAGKEANRLKELFITEFDRTVQKLDSQKKQMLLEHQDSTLLSFEQKQIQETIKSLIYAHYPNISHQARRKYFAQIHADIKRRYQISSYRDIPRKYFDEAIKYIKNYDCPNSGQSSLR